MHTRKRCSAINVTCFVCKHKGRYSKEAAYKGKQTQHQVADELVEEEELCELYQDQTLHNQDQIVLGQHDNRDAKGMAG